MAIGSARNLSPAIVQSPDLSCRTQTTRAGMAWENCPLIMISIACFGASASSVRIAAPHNEMLMMVVEISGANRLVFNTRLAGTATDARSHRRRSTGLIVCIASPSYPLAESQNQGDVSSSNRDFHFRSELEPRLWNFPPSYIILLAAAQYKCESSLHAGRAGASDPGYGVKAGVACSCAGASAIKATPMTMRTATPTSSPRAIMFSHA